MTSYLDALMIRHLFMPRYIYTWQAHDFKSCRSWRGKRIARVSFEATFGANGQYTQRETYFAWVNPQ